MSRIGGSPKNILWTTVAQKSRHQMVLRKGNQLVMDSEDYTYTSAKALPRTYQAGAKTYVFQGWFKGKNKPATLKRQ